MANRPAQKETRSQPHFLQFNNLACETAGGKRKKKNQKVWNKRRVIFATDEWFAPARNLLKRDPPEFIASAFTEYGKWMDGWETRRKRIPAPSSLNELEQNSCRLVPSLIHPASLKICKKNVCHDWCIVQLGVPGIIHGFDVDTSFFTGNYAPFASIQAACLDQILPFSLEGDRTGMAASPSQFEAVAQLRSESWEELVPMTKLKPGYSDTCHSYLSVAYPHRVTHIRVNMYPDGGIARLKVYGIGKKDWSSVSGQDPVDLVALVNGGVCVGFSDAHYGHPRNMIGLGRADNMGDGWETARRLDRPRVLKADEKGILQVPGCEWAIFRLGHPGIISKIELDTNHFKGNFPDSCRIEACSLTPDEENGFILNQWSSDKIPAWKILLPPQKLKAHHRHAFSGPAVVHCGPVSHVRMVIAPDGGVSRLRLWGRPVSNHRPASKL